jgi:hypothetical protein
LISNNVNEQKQQPSDQKEVAKSQFPSIINSHQRIHTKHNAAMVIASKDPILGRNARDIRSSSLVRFL